MNKRTLLSIAALTLVSGWGDYYIQPQPAGAESEAGLEAPMYVGRRRRGRRGGGGYNNNQQNQQQKQQLKMEAQTLKNDQMESSRHLRQLGKLRKKDIIHNYGAGNKGNANQGQTQP
jgi:hypothetical protein